MSDVSVFETNIRFVGGLLACFALTGDVLFKEKAQQIADKLLPAFQTQTGIPNALVNFKTGVRFFILILILKFTNCFSYRAVKTTVGQAEDQVSYLNSELSIWNLHI